MYFDERENILNYVSNSTENTLNEEYNKHNHVNMDFDNFVVNNYRLNNIASLETGFNRGNMFNDLYQPYKNYNFVIKVNNKQDELLLKIQELSFALNDLNLYLDLYPTDTEALKIFVNYATKLKELKYQYSNTYTPLCAEENKSTTYFNYIKSPWPWNEGGVNV